MKPRNLTLTVNQIRRFEFLGTTVDWCLLYPVGTVGNLWCCEIVDCEIEPTLVSMRFTLLAWDLMWAEEMGSEPTEG